MGGESSGKLKTIQGDLRDPGLFILLIEDVFNNLYESQDRENYCLKMSMFVNKDQYFYDLLIENNFPLKLHEKYNGIVQPLGLSEVIVTNLRTALKLLKIGLSNIHLIETDENQAQNILKNSNVVLQLYLEKTEKQISKHDLIISTFKMIKVQDGIFTELMKEINENKMLLNLQNCLRLLSKQNKNDKNVQIPFRKHIFTEYLRDSISGNSQTEIVCCLNSLNRKSTDTTNILRMGHYCQKIFTNPKEIKYQHMPTNISYTDVIENLNATLALWLKDFRQYDYDDQQKRERLENIFEILRKLEEFIIEILDDIEHYIQIELVRNALLSKILEFHCKAYSYCITSEDIKEFYVAKLEQKTKVQLLREFIQLYPSIDFVIEQLELNRKKFQKDKENLAVYIRNLYEQSPQTKSLTHVDLEKLNFMCKLINRFNDIIEKFVEYSCYIPQIIRADIKKIFQEQRDLEKHMEDEGYVINPPEVALEKRKSIVSSRHQSISGNRSSFINNNRRSFQERLSFNSNNALTLERNRSGSKIQKIEESLQQQQSQYSDEIQMDEYGNNNENYDEFGQQNNYCINQEKIKELQIKLKIINPFVKEVFVNNKKLSVKLPIEDSYKQFKRQQMQTQSEKQNKFTDSIQDQQDEENSQLVEQIFTNNVRYRKISNNDKVSSFFATQIQLKNSNNNTFLNEKQNNLKFSISSIQFHQKDIHFNRKYPTMLNTVYSFKLPQLQQTLNKEKFKKFLHK